VYDRTNNRRRIQNIIDKLNLNNMLDFVF
ncbi:hypothetical protein SASC598O11_000300, partial [Snodgrassella alvi SCGC AB-598-O11]